MHETRSILPGPKLGAEASYERLEQQRKGQATLSRRRRKNKLTPDGSMAGTDVSEAASVVDAIRQSSTSVGQAWACPHTGIVQEASLQKHLRNGTGGICLAVVKPIKPATTHMLQRIWRELYATKMTEQKATQSADRESILVGEGVHDDSAHLGLTKYDLLRRVRTHRTSRCI